MLSQVKKVILAVTALVVAVGLVSLSAAYAKEQAGGDDSVVAIVNGDKILKRDVMTEMQLLQVKQEDEQKAFPSVVSELINKKLISDATNAAKIEQSAAFVQRLAEVKAQLAQSMFLDGYVNGKVNDEDVKAEYDKLVKQNEGKMEVHARQIVVPTEAEAKQIIKDLGNGADFQQLAKERSKDPTAKDGGDVGYFAKGELIPAFSDAAFKLKPGTYTKTPVHTQFGWHVIYVEGKRKRIVPPLNQVEDTIRKRLGQQVVAELLKSLRAKAKIQQFDAEGHPVEGPASN